MGDGTGAVMLDGKMEDDASLKQCLVMVELAERLADDRPRAGGRARAYDAMAEAAGMSRPAYRPRRSVLYMPALQRAGPGEGQDAAVRRADPRPRGRRRARRQGQAAREDACAAARIGRVRRGAS